MLVTGVDDPRHAEAQQALLAADLASAGALAKAAATPGLVWPLYVLAVVDWFSHRPMRAVAKTTAGLSWRETEPTGIHYQSLLKQVQEVFTASVPSLLAIQPRPRLSVCLITKDEERNLERCLRSVKSIADEIVVVDTGSTDRTTEIAKRMGAKLGFFEWIDDFAAARNAALSIATGDWVLSIDADEWIDEGSARAVRVSMADPSCCYIAINEGHLLARSFANTRLFPREGAHWHGRLHEDVSFDRAEIERVPLSALVLRHDGRDEEKVDLQAKARRNLRILEKMRDTNDQPSGVIEAYEALTIAAASPNQPENIEKLKAAFESTAHLRSSLSRLVAMTLASNLVQLQRFEEALEVAEKAETHGLQGLWSMYLRSRYAFMQGNREEAHRYAKLGLETVDEEGPVDRMRSDLQTILKATE